MAAQSTLSTSEGSTTMERQQQQQQHIGKGAINAAPVALEDMQRMIQTLVKDESASAELTAHLSRLLQHQTEEKGAATMAAFSSSPLPASSLGSMGAGGGSAISEAATASSNANMSKKVCKYAESCVNYNCARQHPPGRRQPCRYGDNCKRVGCIFLHPTRGQSPPPTPNNSTQDCRFGLGCVNYSCNRAHPAGRRQACRLGVNCTETTCPFLHPKPTVPAVSAVGTLPSSHSPSPSRAPAASADSDAASAHRLAARTSPMSGYTLAAPPLFDPLPEAQAQAQDFGAHGRVGRKACLMCNHVMSASAGASCPGGHFVCFGPLCMRRHLSETLASESNIRDLRYSGCRIHCIANECPFLMDINALAAGCGLTDVLNMRLSDYAEQERLEEAMRNFQLPIDTPKAHRPFEFPMDAPRSQQQQQQRQQQQDMSGASNHWGMGWLSKDFDVLQSLSLNSGAADSSRSSLATCWPSAAPQQSSTFAPPPSPLCGSVRSLYSSSFSGHPWRS